MFETELNDAQLVIPAHVPEKVGWGFATCVARENLTGVPDARVPTLARKRFVCVGPLLLAKTGTVRAAPPPKFEFLRTAQYVLMDRIGVTVRPR